MRSKESLGVSEKLCVWKRLSTKVVGWVYLCGGLHLEDKGGWQSRARGRPSENNQQWVTRGGPHRHHGGGDRAGFLLKEERGGRKHLMVLSRP